LKELPRRDIADWKEIPLEHYGALFSALDPAETAERCNLPFDQQRQTFTVRLVGVDYTVSFPAFAIANTDGVDDTTISEKVLILRYLCAGKWSERHGKSLSYRETSSSGETYFKSFEGRCIKRLVRTFGATPEVFARVMEETPALHAEKAGKGFAYRFEFISNLYMSMLIWPGDDEFPASGQILFDDNVPLAFAAEDLAIAGEVVLGRLKKRASELPR
jgi:hypothetical protein